MRRFCLFAFVTVWLLGLAKETLPYRSVGGKKPGTEKGAVWNLSDAIDEHSEGASYIIYGDSLVSETIDGLRRWYEKREGKQYFVREESKSFFVVPDSSMSCQGSAETSFSASGLVDNLFPVSRRGMHVCDGPIEGYIVVITGDTIPATMSVEKFDYEEKVSPTFDGFTADDVPGTLSRRLTTLYRWYLAGRRLAVAVRCIRNDADKKETRDVTYVYDFSDGIPESDILRAQIIKDRLAKSTVVTDGNKLRIRLTSPFLIDFGVDLMSDSGISYHHSAHSAQEYFEFEIPTSNLPPGRYICAISSGGVVEKRMLTMK